jgi:phosphate transport system permease protein
MSATETGRTGPGPGRPSATAAAELDPAVSPATTHDGSDPGSPVPRVLVTRRGPTPPPRRTGPARRRRVGRQARQDQPTGDRIFRGLASGSGFAIVGLVLFVGIFLLALALPALLQNQDNFLTSRNWVVVGNELRFGILGLLWTTVLSSVLAMIMAVPVAVGVALFLTQYLPPRFSGPLSFVVDLLAAVPSIIFGLWGLTVLARS